MGRSANFIVRAGALLTLLVIAVFAVIGSRVTEAHKAVTSKYTYNDHLYPIFRDRCGSCHAAGAATPMSLLTYKDALPWAESIREELAAAKMPPWFVDAAGPAARGGHPISSREVDMILTWATGGTPEGDPAKAPPPAPARQGWSAGPPDLVLQADEHSLPQDVTEESASFVLPTGTAASKWVRLAELLPGTPAVVRDALISVENGPTLSAWVAGDEAIASDEGTAFKLPAGATIRLQIHYKKPWQEEHTAQSDRSSVGLYFVESPMVAGIETWRVGGPASDSLEPRTLRGSLEAPARVVALRPSLDRPYRSLDVRAITPSGTKVDLLTLRMAQPEWRRRYWLKDPVSVPSGSTIEVAATPLAVDSGDPHPREPSPLEIAVEYVRP